jgi:hypothetical protein
MDITEYVKRNNFAVAQYETESRCAAQNYAFSSNMTEPLQALRRAHRSRAGVRIAVARPNARITVKPSRGDGPCPRKSMGIT